MVDLDTVDDPTCRELLERFDRAGVTTAVWDITSDAGLPAFRAVIVDPRPGPLRPYFPGVGTGCHPLPNVALRRTLTEAAQTRLTLITGARDDMGVAKYVFANDEARHRRLLTAMSRAPAIRKFRDVPSCAIENIEDQLAWIVERLRAIGVSQAIAIDLSRPRLGIPVVRVVVPGLEGISDAPGFQGGQRYRQKRAEQRQ
jgi:ribosomal protein S12 methylthiotransferase accessory factor